MSKPKSQRQRVDPDALLEATGKEWEKWFAILDDWDGTAKSHTAIARFLTGEHGVPGWWAQTLTVGYEQERGLRAPGQTADGTFTANVSKTIYVSADAAFDRWNDEERRNEWLPDAELSLRTATRPKTLRFDFGDDGSRVVVGIDIKNMQKVVVFVSHEKLPDAEMLKVRKAFWKERLAILKEVAEAEKPQ